MSQCKDCVHWKLPNRDAWEFPKGWGFCERAKSNDGSPVQPDTKMFALDASAYNADLTTSPKFGCIEHQNRVGTEVSGT